MIDLNPHNPEAERLRKIKEEAMKIGGSLPQITTPPKEEYDENDEEMMHYLRQLSQMNTQRTLMRQTPEPAKMTEYLITPQPYTFEEKHTPDGKIKRTLRGGDAPENTILENYGVLSKDVKLSNLSQKDIRVLDVKMEAMRIVAHWNRPPYMTGAEYILEEENAEIMNLAAIRRALNGFERIQETKTTMENIQTLHTEGQMQYQKQKNSIWGLLTGR